MYQRKSRYEPPPPPSNQKIEMCFEVKSPVYTELFFFVCVCICVLSFVNRTQKKKAMIVSRPSTPSPFTRWIIVSQETFAQKHDLGLFMVDKKTFDKSSCISKNSERDWKIVWLISPNGISSERFAMWLISSCGQVNIPSYLGVERVLMIENTKEAIIN